IAAAILSGCSDAITSTAPSRETISSTPSAALVSSDGSIPGHYIVVADWTANVPSLVAEYGITPRHIYTDLLNGFSAALPSSIADALASDPRVLKITVQRQLSKIETVTQTGATWGLDRIDQRALPLNQTYSYDFTGAGVTAYIIDTGIRYSHSEFEGRASVGFNVFAADPTDPVLGYDGGDCEGHGTHVAGTVGGKTFGVAKQVKLVGVRVLNCVGYGSDADVIAGMDWVAKNATLPAVANMSLGDVIPTKTMGTNGPVDDAVKAIVASGISLAVAAGNGWGNGTVGADACMFPISNVPEAITVAASTATDARTSWSNYGACIDIFAPGSSIMSATFDNDNSSGTKSGTSMASPHVAGAAALVLQQAPGATPKQVRDVLVSQATQNIVTPVTLNSGHTMNSHLLYSRAVAPVELVGKQPKNNKPCTPRRQRDGAC
ncbi:MAG TPA: S8 family serine peptidase, partial [Gemmatimonadaceae bacterium]|nr:S8 family serine peptidase [Gemmatimonadaceae bacterium]